jgi:hypothetical protein
MKAAVSAFLVGLMIGVVSATMLVTVGATSQLVEIERRYEVALTTSDAAFDTLYELYRTALHEGGNDE